MNRRAFMAGIVAVAVVPKLPMAAPVSAYRFVPSKKRMLRVSGDAAGTFVLRVNGVPARALVNGVEYERLPSYVDLKAGDTLELTLS